MNQTDIILDVGSGSGRVAQSIRVKLGAKVICIDIKNNSKVNNLPIIFDGINIPFKNNTFTNVIACFILHHAPNQGKLLAEMKRVTNYSIIVIEDVPFTIIDSFFILFHKITARINYNSTNMRFRKNAEWHNFFQLNRLVLKQEVVISKNRELVYPVARRLYWLVK